MSKIKTPREKKLASLALDRRNAFGENDKASRNLIPLRKQQSHQATRRAAKQPLLALGTNPEEDLLIKVEQDVREKVVVGERNAFRKGRDASLGQILVHRQTGDWTPQY